MVAKTMKAMKAMKVAAGSKAKKAMKAMKVAAGSKAKKAMKIAAGSKAMKAMKILSNKGSKAMKAMKKLCSPMKRPRAVLPELVAVGTTFDQAKIKQQSRFNAPIEMHEDDWLSIKLDVSGIPEIKYLVQRKYLHQRFMPKLYFSNKGVPVFLGCKNGYVKWVIDMRAHEDAISDTESASSRSSGSP